MTKGSRPHRLPLALASMALAAGTQTPLPEAPEPKQSVQRTSQNRPSLQAARLKKKRALARPTQTARELYEMAERAKEGTPPATSSADFMLTAAMESGDFARANQLRKEVKARAGELLAIADAQAKRERRAAKHGRS